MTPLAIGVLMVLATVLFCVAAAVVFAMADTLDENKSKRERS